jgi:serine/threonine protein kinase
MVAHLHPRELRPGHEVDGIRILQRLDQGTVGVVFEVEKAGQRFALKFDLQPVGPRDSPEPLSPLTREMCCLLELRHHHIARIVGSSIWPHPVSGYRYMLLELAEGPAFDLWTLYTYPTPHQLVVVLDKICSALEYMHQRHIFHRNLSPRNIVVNPSSQDPVLVDFSLGDFPFGDPRNEPLHSGFPRYPSPELVRFWSQSYHRPHARYTFRETDELYALGAMLYELLTWPWPDESSIHWPPVSSGGGPPAPLDVTQGRVPPGLSDLVLKLIAPYPEQRPANASEVRQVLADLKKREGPMWHTPFYPPPTRPSAPPLRARVRAALARALYRLPWRGLWPR